MIAILLLVIIVGLGRTLSVSRIKTLHILVLSVVAAVLSQTDIWLRLSEGYAGDSLYTLSPLTLVGLVFISGALVISLLLLNLVKTRAIQQGLGKYPWFPTALADVVIISVVYWMCLTLIPQLYYVYYLLVFEQLPTQWVIKPMSIHAFFQIISLSAVANASNHFSGLVYWCLVYGSALQWAAYRSIDQPHRVA